MAETNTPMVVKTICISRDALIAILRKVGLYVSDDADIIADNNSPILKKDTDTELTISWSEII